MDPLTQIEFNAAPARYTTKDDNPPLGSPALERDKRTIFWISGVLDCFSTVLALFKNGKDEESQEDNWEVPYELITDMVYLGAGAQGVVYGGSLKGEMVAIKKLRTQKSEPKINHLRKLNHQNIVRFRGVCTRPQFHCIIMEYCQYGPLSDFLHNGVSFHPKQLICWARDIALGMAYLHSHKIIHRDLKSPNVLITDNLVVKVSDFGTSREWNDVSAIMSFTGTVAWMAPEVIRHEPCSERVDVWSFGVVMWELLTQEVPYKNLETHAIMWGVGTDTIALPVPSTCPSSLQLLLNQCWSRVPRNRPPFKIIAAHLEMAGEELCSLDQETFNATQVLWREEVHGCMKRLYTKGDKPQNATKQRREDLNHARDVRYVYEQQLSRANELYMEVCAVRLQLEQRERIIAEKELALSGCRCGIRKNLKHFHRQTSTSSDSVKVAMATVAENIVRRRKKKHGINNPAQLAVNLVEDKPNETQTTTATVVDRAACVCSDESVQNNNLAKQLTLTIAKDTIVEDNGNIIVKDTGCLTEVPVNDNYVPKLAHV